MSLMDLEFTAGGLFAFVFSFLLLFVPAAIFFLETTRREEAPKASAALPIPSPTKIIDVRIYPIKSCRGFSVKSRKLLKTGLDLDRRWMFIDAQTKKFLTIRQISKMTLIDTALTDNDELSINIRSSPSEAGITVPAYPSKKWLETNCELLKAEIWGKETDGYAYSETLTAPFSRFFEKEVRLLYKGPTLRILRGSAAPSVLGRTESTLFADMMPLQIASMKSMEELNSRLVQQGHEKLSIERFRPNIVVEGTQPWGEDVWKTVRINEGSEMEKSLTLDVACRCARCQVPNVDPDTAVKDKKQPWDTLMSYRRIDRGITFKPCFGMLCVPRGEGEVRVGMELEILEVTSQHKYLRSL